MVLVVAAVLPSLVVLQMLAPAAGQNACITTGEVKTCAEVSASWIVLGYYEALGPADSDSAVSSESRPADLGALCKNSSPIFMVRRACTAVPVSGYLDLTRWKKVLYLSAAATVDLSL